MGIGQIIGGALAGYGDGLQQQTLLNNENQRQEQLAELTAAREQALASLQHGYKMDEQQSENAAVDQRDANHQARDFAYSSATNTQKQAFEQQNIRLKGNVDLTNDKTIAALRNQYSLNEDQVKSMLELKNQLAVAGQTADHWGVTTDGRMVAFNKQGGVLRYSENKGSFIPSGESQNGDDSLGGAGTIAGERGSRGGTVAAPDPAASSSTPAAQGNQAAALAQLGNVYAAASQNPAAYRAKYPGMFDAQGNILPKDVVIQRLTQSYGG